MGIQRRGLQNLRVHTASLISLVLSVMNTQQSLREHVSPLSSVLIARASHDNFTSVQNGCVVPAAFDQCRQNDHKLQGSYGRGRVDAYIV
eukprot:188234-Amphidinium_carterae.1